MKVKMTDRERVLMNIAVDTARSWMDKPKSVGNGWTLVDSFGGPAPQFVPEDLAEFLGMPLKEGDIVKCQTNPNHPWGISEFVEQLGYSEFLLREIGGDKLLRMSNESLAVLRFMRPERLYTGVKYRLYIWAVKAFTEQYNPKADYLKRFGGAEFEGSVMRIRCRPHIWAVERRDESGAVTSPRTKIFELTWNKKTRLKDIVAAMLDQGFGDDFEYVPKEGKQ